VWVQALQQTDLSSKQPYQMLSTFKIPEFGDEINLSIIVLNLIWV